MRYFIFFLSYSNSRGHRCKCDVTCSGEEFPSRDQIVSGALDSRPELSRYFTCKDTSVTGFQEVSKEDYDNWGKKLEPAK